MSGGSKTSGGLFQRFSIRALLIGSGVVGAVFAVAMAGVGYFTAEQLSASLKASADEEVALQNHTVVDSRMDALRSDALRVTAINTGISRESTDDVLADLKSDTEQLQTALHTNSDATLTPQIDANYDKILALSGPLIGKATQQVELTVKNPAAGADAYEKFRGSFEQVEALMDQTRGLLRTQVTAMQAESDRDVAFEWKLFAIMIVAGLLAAGALSTAITRATLALLRQMSGVMDQLAGGNWSGEIPATDRGDDIGVLARAMASFRDQLAAGEQSKVEQTRTIVDSVGSGLDSLAKGDLTHRVTSDLTGPFAKLKDDFNGALTRLQDTMKNVLTSTAGISTGAGEISQAADDLSRRTEQQAASLEETAAALEEITATVKKTAQNAKDASVIVISARSAAEDGGRVVETAIKAMGQIENSSKQITDIIGVIDEIAFQTNLLALNAGVEAARAGDAGKGFAVVASEVRALAQRSSEAAREIKTLIKTSGEQVNSGVKLVGESGEALKRIVDQVVQINTLVTEMAQAAQQQSTGIEEVNVAVSQMDQVTQQNAAMVEQSTAASRNLATETGELSDLVSFFNVGAEDAPRRTARQASPHAARAVPRAVPRPQVKTAAGGRRGGAALAVKPSVSEEEDWQEF